MGQIIRAFWGDDQLPRAYSKILREVERSAKQMANLDQVVFVFGDENAEAVRKFGFEQVVQLSEDGMVFPPGGRCDGSMWRHKTAAIREGLARFGEVIHVDWDVSIPNKLPGDLWDRLREKGTLQMPLQQYFRRQCYWRKDDCEPRKLPYGCFIYISDVAHLDAMQAIWDEHGKPAWTDEHPAAFYTDQLTGGWQGVEEYERRFEPYCCVVRRSPLSKESIAAKVPLFICP